MAIRYIGKWGFSPNGDSPTLWVDEATGDYFMQGYRVEDPDVQAELLATADRDRIPAQETLIRFPADMAALFLNPVREITARGARVRRVQIVSEPATDGIRFEEFNDFAEPGAAADAEVRWAPRRPAAELPSSDGDCWIIDGTAVLFDEITADDEASISGKESVADPTIARLCGAAVDAAHDPGLDRPECTA